MAGFSRQWPRASSDAPTTYAVEQRIVHRHRVLGISLRAVTGMLSFLVFWNLVLVALGIAIGASQGRPKWEGTADGQNDYEYSDSSHRLNSTDRAGVVFLWCTFPFVALVLSTFDLVRRNSLTVRRAAFAAAFGATIYIFAFILWRDCAYSSSYEGALYPVCQHDPNAKWFDNNWLNPLALIWVLPWLALVAAIFYVALTALALVALRRQRRNRIEEKQPVVMEHRKSPSLVEIGQPSKEYAEMGTRSIREMESEPVEDPETLTLPSRTMSTMIPSRQMSLATNPPNYRESTGEDEELGRVWEKDEKDEKKTSELEGSG